MPYTLLIDTAFESCQIALWHDVNGCVGSTIRQGGGKHDHILATMTQELFHAHGCAMADIERIFVTTGPGRFTGLRVGIAFARGLALVHDTPVYGVQTTDIMAWDMQNHLTDLDAHAAVVLTVKRGESFVYGFRPQVTAITRVMDEDLIAYFPQDKRTAVAGVIIPETRAALENSAHIHLLEAVYEPSLAGLYAVGCQQVHAGADVQGSSARPYYAS